MPSFVAQSAGAYDLAAGRLGFRGARRARIHLDLLRSRRELVLARLGVSTTDRRTEGLGKTLRFSFQKLTKSVQQYHTDHVLT